MLLQNPQLAYALLQAQVVMRIVDPEIALVRRIFIMFLSSCLQNITLHQTLHSYIVLVFSLDAVAQCSSKLFLW